MAEGRLESSVDHQHCTLVETARTIDDDQTIDRRRERVVRQIFCVTIMPDIFVFALPLAVVVFHRCLLVAALGICWTFPFRWRNLIHSLLVAVLGLSRHNPQRFDRVSNWVVSCLLHSPDTNARAALLSNFIRLLEHLISINNFTSSIAILSALNSACIQRLKSTWKVSLSHLLIFLSLSLSFVWISDWDLLWSINRLDWIGC